MGTPALRTISLDLLLSSMMVVGVGRDMRMAVDVVAQGKDLSVLTTATAIDSIYSSLDTARPLRVRA